MSNNHAPVVASSPRPGNAQWIGARQEQQDAFGFAGFDERGQANGEAVLAVVADGMGGLSGGRAASQGAVSAFLAAWNLRPAQQPVPERLLVAIEAANRAVHQLACTTAGEGEVGTTLVAVVIAGRELYWIAAGDSRIYWYRAADGSLTPCNEEHNLALQLWRQAPDSGMSPDEIDHYPGRDHLISFLGLEKIPEIDRNVRPLTLQPGDQLLLCSDGVDGTLTLEDLTASLAGDPQKAAEGIIARVQAQNRPHQDNATVAILALATSPPAAVVAPVSDPPTRRRPAAPPTPPANKKPKTTTLVSGGLILASLLGIAGWYYLQGRPPLDPNERPTSPAAEVASKPAEQASDSGAQQGQTEQERPEGQELEPQTTVPTPDGGSAVGEEAEPPGDGSEAQAPATSTTPDTQGDGGQPSAKGATENQREGKKAVPQSSQPSPDPADNPPPTSPSAAPPAHGTSGQPVPASTKPWDSKAKGEQTDPRGHEGGASSSRPGTESRGQSPIEGAEEHRNAGEKPAAKAPNPVQSPPGPGRFPPYPHPQYPMPSRMP